MSRTRRFKVAAAGLLGSILAALASGSPARAIANGTPNSEYPEPEWATVKINIDYGDRGCSGVWLGDQWLITAASCFADDSTKGFHIPPGPPKKFTTVNGVKIVQLVPRSDRDLVLAKIEKLIYGLPARLADTTPRIGEKMQIAGWGRTHNKWVPKDHQIGEASVTKITDTTIRIAGQASTCKGDAGGPTYRQIPTVGLDPTTARPPSPKYELVAIHGASWQHGCIGVDQTRNGAIEARVDNILDWIREQTKH
ncbi:hypothetical protein GCM10012275_30480 [Longimycelium tulufanense]|uniref:Peptidase S1 domain-containing protein n=1 Tax=Longimycelium tulufanense TaxID=907463 RepID=A0A8J3CFB6_9PSEU|nr:trypsin-like serine protease [Longimycelium tulufanense]GGM57277.1 hypothetical protein GCM10012275_30480 [Longimycelium tulufanense]